MRASRALMSWYQTVQGGCRGSASEGCGPTPCRAVHQQAAAAVEAGGGGPREATAAVRKVRGVGTVGAANAFLADGSGVGGLATVATRHKSR